MKNKRNWLIALGAFVVVGVVGLAVYSNQSGGLFKGSSSNIPQYSQTQEIMGDRYYTENENKYEFKGYKFIEIKSEQNSKLGNSKLSVLQEDVKNGRIRINTNQNTAFTIINQNGANDILFKFELDKSSIQQNEQVDTPVITFPGNDMVEDPIDLTQEVDDTLKGKLVKVDPKNTSIIERLTSNGLVQSTSDLDNNFESAFTDNLQSSIDKVKITAGGLNEVSGGVPNFEAQIVTGAGGIETMTGVGTGATKATGTLTTGASTTGTQVGTGTFGYFQGGIQNPFQNPFQKTGTLRSSFNFMNVEKAFAAESNNPLAPLQNIRLVEIDPTKTINYFNLKDLNVNLNDTNKTYDLSIGYVDKDDRPVILMYLQFYVQDEEKKIEPVTEIQCTDKIYPTLINYTFQEGKRPADTIIMTYDVEGQSDSITNILNVVSNEKGADLCEEPITQFKFNIKSFNEKTNKKGSDVLYSFNLDPSKYNQESFVSRKTTVNDENDKNGSRSYALVHHFKKFYNSQSHKLVLDNTLLDPNTLYVMEVIGEKDNSEKLNLSYLFNIIDDNAKNVSEDNKDQNNEDNTDQEGCIAFDHAKFSPTSQKDATDKITFTYQFYDINDNPVGFSIDGACYSSLSKWFGNDTKIDDSQLKALRESSLSLEVNDTSIKIPFNQLFDNLNNYGGFIIASLNKVNNTNVILFTLDPNKLPKDMEKGQTYSLSFGKAAASFSFKGSQTKNGGDLGDENGGSAGTNNNDSGKKGGSSDSGKKGGSSDSGNKGTGSNPTPTKETNPSAKPCIVGDKTFYLAEGPDSAYCKDLQSLGEKIARADQAPETPQVRYTTGLFAQRVVADTITKLKLNTRIKVRNLPNDWYKSLADAKEIAAASDEEIANFKAVYASGILRGRKDPKTGEVTLAPLSRIKYIEILALLDQSINSVIGYTPSVSDSNMPPFALAYRNNPDTDWMYRSIAFGIQFNIITKNEFNANTIQDFATREDMARFLARFQSAIEKNPKLLGGK